MQVFINPGNPTGQCLTEENIKELIVFCHDNGLVMCADEVYQENIYNSKLPFISARKVTHHECVFFFVVVAVALELI